MSSEEEEDQLFQEGVPVPVSAPRQTIKLITKGYVLMAQREDLHKVMGILNVKEFTLE